MPVGDNPIEKNKYGRRGDPRMHAALAAKLANPKLSPHQAIVAGGFCYPSDIDDDRILDSDKISLGQRKNQLSRRLRLARQQEQRKRKSETLNTQQSPKKPTEVSPKTNQPKKETTTVSNKKRKAPEKSFMKTTNTGSCCLPRFQSCAAQQWIIEAAAPYESDGARRLELQKYLKEYSESVAKNKKPPSPASDPERQSKISSLVRQALDVEKVGKAMQVANELRMVSQNGMFGACLTRAQGPNIKGDISSGNPPTVGSTSQCQQKFELNAPLQVLVPPEKLVASRQETPRAHLPQSQEPIAGGQPAAANPVSLRSPGGKPTGSVEPLTSAGNQHLQQEPNPPDDSLFSDASIKSFRHEWEQAGLPVEDFEDFDSCSIFSAESKSEGCSEEKLTAIHLSKSQQDTGLVISERSHDDRNDIRATGIPSLSRNTAALTDTSYTDVAALPVPGVPQSSDGIIGGTISFAHLADTESAHRCEDRKTILSPEKKSIETQLEEPTAANSEITAPVENGKKVDEERLESALQHFRLESDTLYKRCMLLVGYAQEELDEHAYEYLNFSSRAWMMEGDRLRDLFSKHPVDVNNPLKEWMRS